MTSSRQVRALRVLSVLWPAFMASVVLEGLLFTLFDPLAMRWTDNLGEPFSPVTVYSLGFLAIWACISVAVAMARSMPTPVAQDADSSGAMA